MKFLDKSTIKLDKVENELDNLVLDFVKILEKYTKYVIVSDYVVILFGRARATEDIDIFIEKMNPNQFKNFFKELEGNSYYCLNSDDARDMHEHLEEGLALRFAKKGSIIPNFEIKFVKREINAEALRNPLKVVLPSGEVLISNIEQQIAFKRYFLKSDKDLEDAEHLEKVFEGKLDKNLIQHYKKIIDAL
ncbi:MAG: hypothetical protein ISS93_02550 [Candidatus Aenigmarchaeota archaeon]|nr:hypothetical protein [Candidatus Aenigmarchaeota archaeon]